jgi:hypothetical protein
MNEKQFYQKLRLGLYATAVAFAVTFIGFYNNARPGDSFWHYLELPVVALLSVFFFYVLSGPSR